MRFEDTNDGTQSGIASVQIGPLDDGVGFYVEDDGWGAPADVRDAVFDGDDSYDVALGGQSVFDGDGPWGVCGDDSVELPDDIGFTVLREVANTDGWDVTVTDGPTGGVRVEVRDVLPESN